MPNKPAKQQQRYSVRKYKRTPFSRAKYYPIQQKLYSWGAFSQPFLWGAAHGDWTVALASLLGGAAPALFLFNAVSTQSLPLHLILPTLILQQLVATIVRLWAGIRLQHYVFKPRTLQNRLSLMIQTSPERVMVSERFWQQGGVVLLVGQTLFLMYYASYLIMDDSFALALCARIIIAAWFFVGIAAMAYISTYEDKTRELFEENFDFRSLSYFKYEGPHFVLANNTIVPATGFGTYKITEPSEVYTSVSTALELGYRMIDTASFYGNEESISHALKDSSIPRELIFITSKIWNDQQGYVNTISAFEESLARLGVEYLDMVLIHWPVETTLADTWRALEDLYLSGRIKVIGVCNFEIEHLEALAKTARITPLVNQIELHPRFQREELVIFCQQRGIQIEAWASLMRGVVGDIPELVEMAQRYEKTPAQVALQWAHQKGYIVLPKSTNPDRIKENFCETGRFELTSEDMKTIAKLDQGMRIGPNPETYSWHWPESTR